jgi:hypothetical protein
MKKSSNVAEFPRPEASVLTLGACRARLEANGYAPTSALMPHGLVLPSAPAVIDEAPPWLVSEHPPAVSCVGPRGAYGVTADLAALVVTWPADAVLADRIRAVLESLLGGPTRIGSDGAEVHVLRLTDGPLGMQSALAGAVAFESSRMAGPVSRWVPEAIPLDGRWQNGDLLSVAYADLPAISAGEVKALLAQIQLLPMRIRDENAPPPQPSRKAWLA